MNDDEQAVESELLRPMSEHSSAPLLTRAPLTSVRTYYRSQTFTATTGINPLVTAAAPLFSLASKLRDHQGYQNIHSLHEHLIHEIRAFEAQAQTQGCRSETILVARYALCALLDEIILGTSWGMASEWDKYKLLVMFQAESSADERFYVIVERLLEDAKLYIDIIEFMYLILSLGFMGKYRHAADGILQRMSIQNELYKAIRLQRGEFEKALSKSLPFHHVAASPPKPPTSLWMRLAGIAFLLMCVYGGLNYVLALTAAPLQTGLQQIMDKNA